MIKFFIKGFRVNALLTIFSRITGFIRDIVLAFFLGAGIASDIFFIASKLPNLFRRITAEGAMTSSFLPIYSKLLYQDKSDNAQKFSAIICFFLIIFLSILVILFEIFMPFIIKIIAPGIINYKNFFDDIVTLSRFTIIFLPFISMTAFFGAMLNASGRFFYFAFTPIIFNLCIIASCFYINDALKIKALPLAIAMPISGFIQLCFIYYFVKKFNLITKVFYKISNLKQNNFNKFKNNTSDTFKRFFPAVLSGGVFQINILVDTILATIVGFGAVSFLYYSDRIIQLPLGIIGVSLGTVLLSSISHPKVVNDNKKISDQLIIAIKISLYFGIPSMITLLFFSEFIISSLFERGSFDQVSSKSVALALTMYSLGLPFVMIIKCFQSVFIATGEMKKILYISVLQLITNFILSIILMKYILHGGIALATSISTILSFMIYLFYILKNKKLIFLSVNSKNYISSNNILFYFVKISILSFMMIFILYLFQIMTDYNSGIIYLSIFTSIGILFYIFITYITKQIPNELFSKLKL